MGSKSISIIEVVTPSNNEWDKIWSSCEYATYFHSREWAEIWQAYTNNYMNPSPILIYFSDGNHALLPFSMELRKGLIKNYFSSPEGTFGGWIAENNLNEEHVDLLIDFILKKTKNIVWRINPYNRAPILEILKKKGNYYRIDDDETHVVDLTQGFEKIRMGWSRGHKSSTAKAQKMGIKSRIADKRDDWDEYYRVYEDSYRRWGESAQVFYDKKLFSIISGIQSKNMRLWLSTFSDRIIAGALCFYAKKHVVYWHGAALKDFFHLRPVNLLMSDIIKDSCEKGYQWFDFNPSGGIEGVKAFKERFNTLVLPAPVVTQKSRFIRLYIHIKKVFGAK